MTFTVGDSGHTTEHNRLADVVTAGGVVAPAGTVSAPSITSVTDTTTGMYFDSAGLMRFTSGGTLAFTLQAGIWTMSSSTASRPYFILTNTGTDATSGSMYFRKDPSDDAISTGDSLGTVWFQGVNTAGGAVTGAQVKGEADGANNASGVPGRLVFLTSNGTTLTERMRIDSAGLITGSGTSLGAWTAYTPTLGNWTDAGGTGSGVYCQIGKVVHFRAQFVFSGAPTVSGYPTLSLPLGAKTTYPSGYAYVGLFVDASTAEYQMVCVQQGSTSVGCFYPGTNGIRSVPNGTTPFSFGNGDGLYISGTYEAA